MDKIVCRINNSSFYRYFQEDRKIRYFVKNFQWRRYILRRNFLIKLGFGKSDQPIRGQNHLSACAKHKIKNISKKYMKSFKQLQNPGSGKFGSVF